MLTYLDLFKDQIDCICFIEAGEDSQIAADVGTGKTVIAFTAAARALASSGTTYLCVSNIEHWKAMAKKYGK